MTDTNELLEDYGFNFGEGGYSVIYIDEDHKDSFDTLGVDGYDGPGWYVIVWNMWYACGPYQHKVEADAKLAELTSPRPVQSKRTF